MLNTLRGVFESFGFVPIETPHLEYTEVLLDDNSGEITKQVFRFEDQGKRDVCLRYDLTVPFARFVVQHRSELNLPFKRYAIGSSFRGEQPQLGRYREFTQCDFDIVGVENGPADAEVIQVIVSALNALQIDGFVIRVNNRKVMNGVVSALGIDTSRTSDVLRSIDKIDKIGGEAVVSALQSEVGLTLDVASKLIEFCTLQADNAFSIVEKARKIIPENKEFSQGLLELEMLLTNINKISDCVDHVMIDFSIARGLSYYTGTIFETNLLDLPNIGSVCSGGRYDNLTKNYTNENLPGVGGSVGLDRLIAALLELKLIDKQNSPSKVLCTYFDLESLPLVYQIANQIRSNNINVEVYPEADKIKKQFQYAEKQGIPLVLVFGSDELTQGFFTIKNMATGEQSKIVQFADLLKLLKLGQ
jgi:histidyl-tRNA synthetase